MPPVAPWELCVRRALAADATAACDVLRRSIVQLCGADHRHDAAILERWLGNKTPERVAAWFAGTASFAAVAIRGASLAGCALLQRRGEIQLCYVAPEHQGCGAGRGLIAALEAQARDWGLALLYLSSTLTAQQFYARLGYLPAGEPQEIFGMRAFPMTKTLADAPSMNR